MHSVMVVRQAASRLTASLLSVLLALTQGAVVLPWVSLPCIHICVTALLNFLHTCCFAKISFATIWPERQLISRHDALQGHAVILNHICCVSCHAHPNRQPNPKALSAMFSLLPSKQLSDQVLGSARWV